MVLRQRQVVQQAEQGGFNMLRHGAVRGLGAFGQGKGRVGCRLGRWRGLCYWRLRLKGFDTLRRLNVLFEARVFGVDERYNRFKGADDDRFVDDFRLRDCSLCDWGLRGRRRLNVGFRLGVCG